MKAKNNKKNSNNQDDEFLKSVKRKYQEKKDFPYIVTRKADGSVVVGGIKKISGVKLIFN